MEYKIGDRLVCIIVNLSKYAPCEVVKISKVCKNYKDEVEYQFEGYTSWHNKKYIDDNFREY